MRLAWVRGMFGVALLVGSTSIAACASDATPAEEKTSTVSHQFFENAERRDATASEASRVAQLSTSKCASFFLENNVNRTFVATARHCVAFALTSWCQNDGALVDNAGRAGRCVRVVAADKTHDIAVFEANLAHPSTGDATLRLASYVPKVSSKLIMTGYPDDEDPETARRGKLTTTANCWVLSGQVESPYVAQDQNTLDKSAEHNCSTYGGNSGGPMYLEGTREAIGLPFTYIPDDYTRNSATDLSTAAFLALTADFVSIHRSDLTAAGIIVSDSPEGSGTAVEEDTDDATDSTDTDAEEESTPAKKKSRPAPAATSGGCSIGVATSSYGAGPLAVVGLGIVIVTARGRRRASGRAFGC